MKKIFVKDEKLNHLDTHADGDATITRGEKRSHDDEDEDNDNDIIYTNANTT